MMTLAILGMDFLRGGNFVCVAFVVVLVVLATSTRRSARRCSRCHEINRPHANFCAQCGAKLPGR